MTKKEIIILTLATVFLSATPLASRIRQASTPAFEVASIKRNMSEREGGSASPRGDRYTATNVPLRTLLVYAYSPMGGQLLNQQLVGGPDWINTDRYDVQATMKDDVRSIGFEQVRLMVRSLLEDRFRLKVHRDTRELPVYHLVVGKSGPKMSQDQTPPDPRQAFIDFRSSTEGLPAMPRGAIRIIKTSSGTTITGTGISATQVVRLLQGESDRMIIDKSGITALFDIHLDFITAANAGLDSSTGPSLFTAIQELGFRLESAKAPLDVLVIDSVQRPTEN